MSTTSWDSNPDDEPTSAGGKQTPTSCRLAKLLAAHAPYDGAFTLRVPGLHVDRRSKPYPEMVRATVTPALCIVAQGAKIVMLGRAVGYLSASQFSREYTRLFGSAPTRDIERLRQDGVLAKEGAPHSPLTTVGRSQS